MMRSVNLRTVVEDVHTQLRPRLLSQGVSTTVDIPQHASAMADYDMLRQAVHNLTINALDAMPDGGELVVTSYTGAEPPSSSRSPTAAQGFRTKRGNVPSSRFSAQATAQAWA